MKLADVNKTREPKLDLDYYGRLFTGLIPLLTTNRLGYQNLIRTSIKPTRSSHYNRPICTFLDSIIRIWTWYAGTLKGYRLETESGYKAMEGART